MFDILLRKQSITVLGRFCPVVLKLSYSDSALVQKQLKLKSIVEEDSSRVCKTPFQKHFIEGLFVNKFQEKVLEYPQLDTLEEVEALKKHGDLAQKLITGTNDNETGLCKVDSKEAISVLKKLELTGFKVPRMKNGFGYLTSEYTYMQEALGLDPSLSKSINEHEDFGVYLINSFGTDIQKEQYLFKLLNGELIASLATAENDFLSFLEDSVNTSATLLSDNQSYQISGEKSWVYNGNHADLFILSANIIDQNGKKSDKPTLFLIDKNTPGVEIHKPIEKIGLKNLSVCKVSFNNVIVPSSCILGNINEGGDIIQTVLSKGKLNNGAHCLAIMKKLVKRCIDHCIYNEFFNEDMCDLDHYKIKIGKIVSRIYAVESMTYLVTGRLDSHTDSDVFLESLIVKIFASESLLFVVKIALEILGREFFTSDDDIMQLAKDSQFYFACDDANDYLRLILSTSGVDYAKKFPRSIFEKASDVVSYENFFFALLEGKDQIFIYKNNLKGYVHKMFTEESQLLECGVHYLNECTTFLMRKYGNKVSERPSDLKNLADILINVYAIAALIGRASRAYCLAVRNKRIDETCAQIETIACFYRILKARELIIKKVSSKFNNLEPFNCSKYSDRYSVIKNLMKPNKLKSGSSKSQKKVQQS